MKIEYILNCWAGCFWKFPLKICSLRFILMNFIIHWIQLPSSTYSEVATGDVPYKSALKNCATFTGKHLCWCLFVIKLQAWRRLQHRGFPANIAEFLRTRFEEHLRTAASGNFNLWNPFAHHFHPLHLVKFTKIY